MARFLNTGGTNFFLEEMVKSTPKGGEARTGKYGDYTLWPESIDVSS